ncbi:MAG: ABC transporter ATP-binding protein [Acidothermus cellulolyticus]|nr:ABC transporter ATP-binding protein [Acidothermus cellulolyticus]
MTDYTPDETPGIALRDISKVYSSRTGDVVAVHALTLAVRPGEFFSLLGPSGCGKTTTLRMIAGFEEPTTGRILLEGRDVTDVPPHRRDVNMVFQNYALFPHLTVWENVAFGPKRKKLPREEIRRRVGEALELVDLVGREKRRPDELSGGQQQRVALARALVNRPRALLLDEPLGALDLKLRQAMQLELKRIQREAGVTFVYVTHDQGEALTMSDRIAVMNAGRVEQLGTPREIYETPSTPFVAGFIGTSNVISAPLTRIDGALALLATPADERVLVPLRVPVPPGASISATVRPEKIRLSLHPPDDGGCRLLGVVREVVYLGTATQYVVATSVADQLVVYAQNDGTADLVPAPGDRIWLWWRPEHSYQLIHADATDVPEEAAP